MVAVDGWGEGFVHAVAGAAWGGFGSGDLGGAGFGESGIDAKGTRRLAICVGSGVRLE